MKEGRSEEGLRAGKTNGERSGVVQEPGEFRVGQCFVEYWISWLNSVLGNDLPESLVRDMTQLLRLQKTTHSTMEEASLFFIYFLNWNIIYLQCVSFWNTTKWFSYIYTHIHTHIYIHITESLSCIYIYIYIYIYMLPWWLRGKESACNAGNAGDPGWIPGSGRSPGGGPGQPSTPA